MRNRKETFSKKMWEEFEKLAIECVQETYCDDGTEVAPTQPIKDNGYDAIILSNSFQDQYILSLLEAKLRSKNVGLRDVAATVIIGFNLGAYRIFFVINNFATPQFKEEVEKFQEKTNTRCTIVDNSIIRSWLTKLSPQKLKKYSPELIAHLYNIKLSDVTNTNQKKFLSMYPSIKNAADTGVDTKTEDNNYYESERIKNSIFHLKSALENRKNSIVWGSEGCGKSTIISKGIVGMHPYSIDMANCLTTRSFAVKILYSLWGIDSFEKEIIFDKSEIDAIVSCIGDEMLNCQTKDTLKYILNTDTNTFHQRADLFNVIILEYFKKLLNLHLNNSCRLFYFYNLEKTSADVLSFLRSFCSLLAEIKVQFLLEIRTPITDNEYYTSSKWEKEVELLKNIDNTAYMTSIFGFTQTESIEYLEKALDGLSKEHAMIIIRSVGTNPLFLHCAVEWLKNNKIVHSYPNNKVLLENFKPFFESLYPEQNMVFAIKWIDFFIKQSIEYNIFLTTLFILSGELTIEFYEELFGDNTKFEDVVNQLEKNKIIFLKNNTIHIGHQVFLAALEQCCSSIRIKKCAVSILKILDDKKEKNDLQKLKILDILYLCENWKRLVTEYKETILYLESTYQFKIAYVYMKKILKSYEELSDCNFNVDFYYGYLEALQRQLQLSASLKYIGQPSEKLLIEQFGVVMEQYKILVGGECIMYNLFYHYINSQYYFRNADYDKALSFCNCIKDNVQSQYPPEHIELLGRLCVGYALAIKEIDGYEAAKNSFERLIDQYPDSKILKGEYLVHLSCMELDSAPIKAYTYTKQVIEMFKNENMQLEYPLFHKYVDLAMELLFAKKYSEAKDSAYTALELAISNGIIAEEGRAKNILGCCEYLINGETEHSISLIKNSCFLLEKSYYIPYLWRSRINLATFYIKQKAFDDALPYIMSAEHHLLKGSKIFNDIEKKLFHSSREYIALLLIGVYYKKYYDEKYFHTIEEIIDSPVYTKHVDELVNGIYPDEVFENSSFLYGKDIFVIG